MRLIKSGDSKTVNIDQVSNIGIDTKKLRIIFNLQYSINIFGKQTPDYVYFEYDDIVNLHRAIKSLLEVIKDDFLISSDKSQRLVAKKCISSINFIERQKRIVFNLNYDITHPNDSRKLTSDFVFWTFNDDAEYFSDYEKLKKITQII